MDGTRFDALAKHLAGASSRRSAMRSLGAGAFGAVLGLLGLADTEAGKKKGKKNSGEGGGGGGGGGNKGKSSGKGKKKKKRKEPCGAATCTGGSFCCDDQQELCCTPGSECCNPGGGTGSCCPSPNRCGRPVGNDAAPYECCPPERQWFTSTGLVRCCPPGERSLGTGISSDDGPCCPEAKYCSTSQTGGRCCPDLAPICLNRTTEGCCTEENACGDTCCSEVFGDCCNGNCMHTESGPWTPCGDSCCPASMECCTNGGQAICCSPGYICPAPCGELPIACCTPESFANGHCCNSDCPPEGCGG